MIIGDVKGIMLIQKAKLELGSAMTLDKEVTEKMIGKSINEIKEITNESIAKELTLPPIKRHCSVLVEEALTKALHNHDEKNK